MASIHNGPAFWVEEKRVEGLTWTFYSWRYSRPSFSFRGDWFVFARKHKNMATMTIVGGIGAVLLLAYLVFALLAPEKLS
jgi:K+-transporting ATPase KdpF subunit